MWLVVGLVPWEMAELGGLRGPFQPKHFHAQIQADFPALQSGKGSLVTRVPSPAQFLVVNPEEKLLLPPFRRQGLFLK